MESNIVGIIDKKRKLLELHFRGIYETYRFNYR